METIGYFFSKKKLKKNQLDELFGASLEFNFEIFKPYIKHRRDKHEIEELYEKFEKLYDGITKK